MSEDNDFFETLTLAINEAKQEIALSFAQQQQVLSQFKEETENEIESLNKQFSTLFLAFGELSTLFQVFSRFVYDQASDEGKEQLEKDLKEQSKKFVEILLESKKEVERLDEEENLNKQESQ
jgi:hypothetical protein